MIYQRANLGVAEVVVRARRADDPPNNEDRMVETRLAGARRSS